MELFWKAVAAALLCAVLGLAMGKQEKEFSLVLSLAGCCLTAIAAGVYIKPMLAFLRELEGLTGLDGTAMTALMRAVGISLVSRLAGLLCQDAGNGALAKTLQTMGSAAILYVSLPVFQAVLTLLREILELL